MADGSKYYDHSPFGPNLGPLPKWIIYPMMFMTNIVALYVGEFSGEYFIEYNDATGIIIAFIAAIGCGLFGRYAVCLETFGSHKKLTKAAIITALIAAIVCLLLFQSDFKSPFSFIILFLYAICL